eukprot:TRINITY_DN550_c0_g1_i3.p1 TRINITY_DN550_c0_g1~~TRINITY_DN550_c0_g1_i3.p1  ORF type:complete len:104 (-),score=46.87 TRINITY_DN550_c0_g1_i3:54-365(-)
MTSFFFFKQKTAYEMLRSLVGSEMCIRDRIKRRAIRKMQVTALRSRGIDIRRPEPIKPPVSERKVRREEKKLQQKLEKKERVKALKMEARMRKANEMEEEEVN